jgi:hypothetical protein
MCLPWSWRSRLPECLAKRWTTSFISRHDALITTAKDRSTKEVNYDPQKNRERASTFWICRSSLDRLSKLERYPYYYDLNRFSPGKIGWDSIKCSLSPIDRANGPPCYCPLHCCTVYFSNTYSKYLTKYVK